MRRFLEKYGIVGIIIHFIPIVIAEGMLSFLEINIINVIIVSVLMAISQSLYSVPLNLIFAFGDKSTNVAKFQVATNVGKLFFMLLSGLILSTNINQSFLIMSIASSIIYLLCVVPIWFSYSLLQEQYKKYKNRNVIESVDTKNFKYFHVMFGIFQVVIDNCLPLYLYVNNLSFSAVTELMALIELCKIGINYLSKYLLKIKKEKIGIIIGVVVYTISLIVILFVKNSLVLYIFTCLCSITFPLTFVPMFKKYCKHIDNTNNTFDGMIDRDVQIFSMRPIYYAIYFTGIGFIPLFVIGIINACAMLKVECEIIDE